MHKISKHDVMNMRFRQLEHIARQLDARETKVRSAKLRKDWLQRQTNASYRQEFDRIRGELSRSNVGTVDRKRLEKREEFLRYFFLRGNV